MNGGYYCRIPKVSTFGEQPLYIRVSSACLHWRLIRSFGLTRKYAILCILTNFYNLQNVIILMLILDRKQTRVRFPRSRKKFFILLFDWWALTNAGDLWSTNLTETCIYNFQFLLLVAFVCTWHIFYFYSLFADGFPTASWEAESGLSG